MLRLVGGRPGVMLASGSDFPVLLALLLPRRAAALCVAIPLVLAGILRAPPGALSWFHVCPRTFVRHLPAELALRSKMYPPGCW